MWWLAGLAGGAILIGAHELRAFERKAAADIAAQLQGGARVVSVRTRIGDPFRAMAGHVSRVEIDARHFETVGLPLFTEPDRSTKGRVRELCLRLSDFRLNGLRVERLEATIPECRYDLGLALGKRQIRLSRSGVGEGLVEVLADDLAPFILRKFREIKRVQVRITPDRLVVEGYGEFIVIQTNFRVEADLHSPDGRTLSLRNAKIEFDGRPADPLSAKTLLDTLNPVVDFERDLNLYDAVRVERVELAEGRLIARGRTKIPIHPDQAWKPGQWVLPHVRLAPAR
jgi:hypothetical protein